MATWALKRVRRARKITQQLGLVVPASWPLKRPGLSRPPLYGVVGDLSARMTTAGRRLRARQNVDGIGIQITHFAVGTGGYMPQIPTQTIPVDPAATGLINEVLRKSFVAFGLTVARPQPEAVSFYCRVEKLEAPYALGELALFATIVLSPGNPGEVGDQSCFALVHFPIDAHNSSKVLGWRVTILP